MLSRSPTVYKDSANERDIQPNLFELVSPSEDGEAILGQR